MIGSWFGRYPKLSVIPFGWVRFGLGQRTSGHRNRDVELEARFGASGRLFSGLSVELEASGVSWDSSGSQWNNRFLSTGARCSLYHTPHHLYPSLFLSDFVGYLLLSPRKISPAQFSPDRFHRVNSLLRVAEAGSITVN